jgi:hypothetical protein
VYAAGASTSVVARPAKCAPGLTASASDDDVYQGDAVTVSGTLTRDVGGVDLPVAGASVPVRLTYPYGTGTKVLVLGTAKTLADGSWSLPVKPTRNGNLSAALVASPSYLGTSVDLGPLTVRMPSSTLTGSVDRTAAAYGEPVVVTGQLLRSAAGAESGVGGSTVSVKVTPSGGKAVVVGTARTLADGSYRVSLPLKVTGAMSVSFAGSTVLPAATADVDQVVAAAWGTAVTLSGTRTVTTTGTTAQLAGTVTRSYGGTTGPAKGLRLKVWFTPAATGVPVLASTVTTTTTGRFAVRLTVKAAGSYTAAVSGVAGHADSTSEGYPVTLG